LTRLARLVRELDIDLGALDERAGEAIGLSAQLKLDPGKSLDTDCVWDRFTRHCGRPCCGSVPTCKRYSPQRATVALRSSSTLHASPNS